MINERSDKSCQIFPCSLGLKMIALADVVFGLLLGVVGVGVIGSVWWHRIATWKELLVIIFTYGLLGVLFIVLCFAFLKIARESCRHKHVAKNYHLALLNIFLAGGIYVVYFRSDAFMKKASSLLIVCAALYFLFVKIYLHSQGDKSYAH